MITSAIKWLTDTLDPRLDKWFGFDVPAKYTNIVSTAIIMWLYCNFIH